MPNEVTQQLNQAKDLKKYINSGSNYFPEDVRDVIRKKGISSPLFYILAANNALFLSGNQSTNLDALSPTIASIIAIDETIEQQLDLTNSTPDKLLQWSSEAYPDENMSPAVKAYLCSMITPMYAERAYADITSSKIDSLPSNIKNLYSRTSQSDGTGIFANKSHATYNPEILSQLKIPSSFEEYLNAVSVSFGMMPIYRDVADNANETAYSITDEVSLRKLESATRILADITTLNKDIKNGGLNLVLEYMRYNQNIGLDESINELRLLANRLINEAQDAFGSNFAELPESIRFAISFAQTLQIVDQENIDISNVQENRHESALRTSAIKLIGRLIQTLQRV